MLKPGQFLLLGKVHLLFHLGDLVKSIFPSGDSIVAPLTISIEIDIVLCSNKNNFYTIVEDKS